MTIRIEKTIDYLRKTLTVLNIIEPRWWLDVS